MPNPDKELTVEECLAELRELRPTYSHRVEVYDFKRRVTYRIEVGGTQIGIGYSLKIAMDQARRSLNND